MVVKEKIALMGMKIAERNVNLVCPWVLYTPKVPKKALKLKKK